MCTVTHCREPRRLLVTMNRDELRDRAAELPPAIQRSADGGCWVAPSDGDRSGAWIGAGDRGLAACLLNRYPTQSVPVGLASRGEIIPLLLDLGDFESCAEWLVGGFDPSLYSPFTLILTSLCGSSAVFAWEGVGELRRRRGFEKGWEFETSSSWRESEVVRFRRRAFREWLQSGAPFRKLLPEFNLLCVPAKEAWSPLMSRRASQTRSITQIEFDVVRDRLAMRYWPQPFSSFDEPHCLDVPLRSEATNPLPTSRLSTSLSP